MQERGRGSIINVSSLAAFAPGKNTVVYGASKAFLNSFSIALQDEVKGSGIEVQALCPGFTRSEFHERMEQEGFQTPRIPEDQWMTSEAVVEGSLAALGSGEVVVIPGEGNRAIARMLLEQQLASLK